MEVLGGCFISSTNVPEHVGGRRCKKKIGLVSEEASGVSIFSIKPPNKNWKCCEANSAFSEVIVELLKLIRVRNHAGHYREGFGDKTRRKLSKTGGLIERSTSELMHLAFEY